MGVVAGDIKYISRKKRYVKNKYTLLSIACLIVIDTD